MAQHHEPAERLTHSERRTTALRLERLAVSLQLHRERRAYRAALRRIAALYGTGPVR